MAYMISFMGLGINRKKKDYNPLLGETYEMYNEKRKELFLAE